METQNTVMKVQSPNIQIIPRTINVDGRELLVQLLKMGDEEGLLTTQVAECLGISIQSLNESIRNNKLERQTFTNRAALIQSGLAGSRGLLPSFLPKPTIQALVKIVNTPQAWAIYRQLWEMVENPRTYIAVSVLYT